MVCIAILVKEPIALLVHNAVFFLARFLCECVCSLATVIPYILAIMPRETHPCRPVFVEWVWTLYAHAVSHKASQRPSCDGCGLSIRMQFRSKPVSLSHAKSVCCIISLAFAKRNHRTKDILSQKHIFVWAQVLRVPVFMNWSKPCCSSAFAIVASWPPSFRQYVCASARFSDAVSS